MIDARRDAVGVLWRAAIERGQRARMSDADRHADGVATVALAMRRRKTRGRNREF